MTHVKTAIKWLSTRVISPNNVLIHFARSGTSIFNSFSTARV